MVLRNANFNLDTDIYEFNDDQKFWQVRDVTMIIAWAYGLTVASLWVLKHGEVLNNLTFYNIRNTVYSLHSLFYASTAVHSVIPLFCIRW